MTLKEMKAMFVVGDVWSVENSYIPKHSGVRTVKAVKSGEVVWAMPDGSPLYSTFPKASEILEAKPGFLKIAMPVAVPGNTLTFKKEVTI